MHIRKFVKASTIGLIGLIVLFDLSAEQQKGKSPNIVLILADNLGRESVGTYGGKFFSTPRIDSIGREGVIFDQCYIGSPLCSPARAGLMTGRYPHCAGVLHDRQPNPKTPNVGNLAPDEVTLAQTLKQAGYHTGIFGKWNLGYDERFLPTRRGFDTYYGINAGHADYYTHIYKKKKYFYRDTDHIDPVGYVDNLCVDEALKWLDSLKNSAKPFFLYLPFFTPHGPYQSPPGYPRGESEKETYGYMIDNMDKNVGKILDKLKAIGAEKNTLVVFMSDQGSSFMNPYNRDLTEGGLKVVCHAFWPGQTASGSRVAAPFISYDWFTTFTELGGGKIPADRLIVGKNVSNLFSGDGQSPHEALYWTYRNADAIREGDWKLHMETGSGAKLYNLAEDPKAQKDLSKEYPNRVADLRKKIEAWKIDPCAKAE